MTRLMSSILALLLLGISNTSADPNPDQAAPVVEGLDVAPLPALAVPGTPGDRPGKDDAVPPEPCPPSRESATAVPRSELPKSACSDALPSITPTPGASSGASSNLNDSCAPTQTAAEAIPAASTYRFWGGGDYLLWWVKSGPTVPLVTFTRNPAEIGALSNPGTQVLLGGEAGGIDYPVLNGGRFTVGGSKDGIGLESSFFFLERQSFHFDASSPGGPNSPSVAVPFFATVPFNFNPAGETSFNPGGAPLALNVQGDLVFWGAEANGLIDIVDRGYLRASLLGGFRFLELNERLTLTGYSPDPLTGGSITLGDAYQSRNNFLGGQIGFRTSANWERFSVDVVGKVAFGNVQQSYWASGFTNVTNGAFGRTTGTYPAGILVQPSNTGKFDRGAFACVPEAQVRVGYRFTENIRGTVGYNLIYVSDVARASGQVNRVINPTQHPVFGGGGFVPPGLPFPNVQATDFWAQGLTFGLDFSF